MYNTNPEDYQTRTGKGGLEISIPCAVCGVNTWKLVKEIRRQEKLKGSSTKAGKTCGTKCGARAAHEDVTAEVVTLNCGFCNVDFQRSKSLVRRSKKSKTGLVFCSKACQGQAFSLNSGLDIQRPAHYGTSSGRKRSQQRYRNIAFSFYPQECHRCGWARFPDILTVHHRDRNVENNDAANLEILCRNCHGIEHYREKYPNRFLSNATKDT